MKLSIKTKYKTWRNSWRKLEHDHEFIVSSLMSVVFFVVCFATDAVANAYATAHAGLPVADIILSNFHAINVFALYVCGPALIFLISVTLILGYPRKIPFAFKTAGIFFLFRSVAVCLTHLGFPPGEYIPAHVAPLLKEYFLGGDLFFSGHVGQPLLAALIFWNHKKIRIFFLFAAVFMAFVVLAGHYHYSIDVFGALLITPTIFEFSKKIFSKDFAYARNE